MTKKTSQTGSQTTKRAPSTSRTRRTVRTPGPKKVGGPPPAQGPGFLEALREMILVLDGATGTMVQGLDLTDADFGGAAFRMLSDLLVFSRPGDQKGIHLAYLRAGAHCIETNTFGATPFRMEEYDFKKLDPSAFPADPEGLDIRWLDHRSMAYHLSKRAATLGREAIAEYRAEPGYDGRPLFVLGSVGPSNRVISKTRADLRTATFAEIRENFRIQVSGLIDGGADVILFETQQDQLEVKAGVRGALDAMEAAGKRLPIMAQVTVDEHARMQIFHTDVHAALVTLQGIGIDVFGINCSIGPDLMEKAVERIARHSRLPVSVIPNAGLPVAEAGRTVFRLEPEEFTRILVGLVDRYGIDVVGGCCGTRPDHIRLLADAMRSRKPRPRTVDDGLWVSGPQNAISVDSSRTLFMIGERLNVRGSAKVKKAVESGGAMDLDALGEVVEEQARGLGLGVLDVCMDSNLVDTGATLSTVIRELTDDFPAAMCIDSFDVDAIRTSIDFYPGRPIVNSISLEEVEPGVPKVDAVISATRHHDPVYIALCTGPRGPGATAAEKLELATAILERARDKWGVPPSRVLVDVNVFPVGSESDETTNFATATLDAVRVVKQRFPDTRTTLGVGNLTTGLAKKPYMRKVLLSVFLDEARKAGLDAAILNPEHYVFVDTLDPHDVALGRKVILERDLDAFAELESIAAAKSGRKEERRSSYDDLPIERAVCEKIKDGFKERVTGTIEIEGFTYTYQDRIVAQVAEAIRVLEPLDFINRFLMRAMQELGDAFGRGDASLPHLLKAADVMKHAMGFLESFMRFKSGADVHEGISYKGTVVLGTVFQDVHSIGKDLAKTLFENYGYRVIDTGVQTPLQDYVDLAREHRATAIGASALLVQTSNHMITLSKLMLEQGLGDLPLLIGGAPVNLRHAGYVAMAGGEDPGTMRDNVFYCPSAMDGVNVLNRLSGADGHQLRGENRDKLRRQFERAERRAAEERELLERLPRREVGFGGYDLDLARAFAPLKVNLSLGELAKRLDKKTLFGLNWRFGGESARERRGDDTERMERLLAEWLDRAGRREWIVPAGVMALYRCQAEGDELSIRCPVDPSQELGRIAWDVVLGRDRTDKFSPAQFFRNRSHGRLDLVGLQISGAGARVEGAVQALKAAGDSEGAHYLQGLADRVAEDLAEELHRRLRELAGVPPGQGQRFSPGYASLSDPGSNALLAKLLEAHKQLGVTLTDAGQFHPTSTTAAVVCFHPEAAWQ